MFYDLLSVCFSFFICKYLTIQNVMRELCYLNPQFSFLELCNVAAAFLGAPHEWQVFIMKLFPEMNQSPF